MPNLKKLPTPLRVLPFEGAVNFRDLGGYITQSGQSLRWGQLYRCGKLDELSASANKAVAELGIKTKIDLRYPDEVKAYPSPASAFPLAANYFWEAAEGGKNKSMLKGSQEATAQGRKDGLRALMQEKYVLYLESHGSIFSEMLAQIAAAQTPLVFHCAAGKDRTGVAAAIILSILEVDRETIMRDYMLTQELLGSKLESWALGGATIDSQYLEFMNMVNHAPYEEIRALFDADESYLNNCFAYIDANYGDFKTYAQQELGLTSDLLTLIKARLLEP